MAVTTHSFKYKPTTAPSGTEDRVLACSHTTDDCHCVINASGQIGYYVSGVFTQIGTAIVSLNEQYAFIIEHDTSGNGCIYLNGQKIGCATNFPTTAINQIGNFKTELKPETGRKPKVGLKPRAVSNIYTRPCCGVIDEYARFNRALSASEVVDLSQSGTLSKVYTLADYKIALMADDGIIATTEKPRYKENWRSIWNADQRTSALPTAIALITVNGSYKSLATAANDAGIWTPTTNGTPAYDYYQAVESWRQMFFVSSGGGTGFLLTANLAGDTDISAMSPTLEARQSALIFAEDALRSAVMIKRQSTAELNAVANANNSVAAYAPKYLGRYYQSHPGAPNNGDWWLVYGVASSPVTRGFWYNNNGTNTLVSTLGTEAQRKYKGSGLEDVLYASNNGYALTSGGDYDPVGIYGVSTMEYLAVNQAFISKLMTKELKLVTDGVIYGGTRYNPDGTIANRNVTGFHLDGDTGKFQGTIESDNNSNTFVGTDAGVNLQIGTGDEGWSNTIVGYRTGKGSATSRYYFNSFFGAEAGYSNTTGKNNSFFGMKAGYYNLDGYENSFFGNGAGLSNTRGNQNSFFGNGAGVVNTEGGGNSFFGHSSGSTNTKGNSNSFFGVSSGLFNSEGGHNSFFGIQSGYNCTTQNYNVCIGANTTINTLAGNYQMNFNNRIRYFEFPSGTAHSTIYNVISTYINSAVNSYLSTMGTYTAEVCKIHRNATTNIVFTNIGSTTILSVSPTQTTTYTTAKLQVAFIVTA